MVRGGGIAIGLLALASCDAPDHRICSAPTPMMEAINLRGDISVGTLNAARRQGAFTRNCVHLWAYRLARSPDQLEAVANAAVAACYDAAKSWDTMAAEERAAAVPTQSPATVSDRSGAIVTFQLAHREELTDLARFYVTQAKVGHCDIP